MCGITGIILKQPNSLHLSQTLERMSTAIAHRGPDGEGFMTVSSAGIKAHAGSKGKIQSASSLPYLVQENIQSAKEPFLGFGHRRLAILDLSPTGHQPMSSANGDYWITFNGEIYNYLELKSELLSLGHHFFSESDTEVIIAAYKQWGMDCVNRFNGMWSFCLFDVRQNTCFASRDRLGVKPFYYCDNTQFFAFASEQKAFLKSGLITKKVSEKHLHDYLLNGNTEQEPDNFFEGIQELMPGFNLHYDMATHCIRTQAYFHLRVQIQNTNQHLSNAALIQKIEYHLEKAVRLRLRSDVEVGTCLSGGIDSSVLAVLMAEQTQKPVHCFTSVFKNETFNEEQYADLVSQKINAKHYKTEPQLSGFLQEVDTLIYSQDVPIWDTSTYAQFKVMQLAHHHHIKVVLDGQGADELFGGYHHHFVAQWNQLIREGQTMAALRGISDSGKTISQPFVFYAKEKIKQNIHLNRKNVGSFFNKEFIQMYPVQNPVVYFESLNDQLIHDIYTSRLKSFLKCEDRCGMWHSVESRTPFSDDIELITLLFSFDGQRKIQQGISKYLLREAVKTKLPPQIYSRFDKKGFETPMQRWMKEIHEEVLLEIKSSNFHFVDNNQLAKADPSNQYHNKLLFKLFVLSKWHKVFA